MTPKQRIRAAIDHQQPDKLPVDFGSSFITGIHCSVVEQLRDHYNLEKRSARVCEPYQMLGEVEEDLLDAMRLDVQPIFPQRTIFGFPNENWKPWTTPWGQEFTVSEHFKTSSDNAGNVYIYPKGDAEAPASGHMPKTSYFFDTIERIDPDFDEDELNLEDNFEEFGPMSKEEVYWIEQTECWRDSDRAISVHLNGTCLGDIALVPAPFLTNPKGVRGVADWYMLSADEPDFLNPVQSSADGMDPQGLKDNYGDRITFWGGGVNTQQTLPFSTPEQVRKDVLSRYEVFAPGSGLVFSALHNVQARTPIKNVIAMVEAVHEYNGDK